MHLGGKYFVFKLNAEHVHAVAQPSTAEINLVQAFIKAGILLAHFVAQRIYQAKMRGLGPVGFYQCRKTMRNGLGLVTTVTSCAWNSTERTPSTVLVPSVSCWVMR